jgi:hypothetical protein
MKDENAGDQMTKEYRFWLYDEMTRYMQATMDIIKNTPNEVERDKALEIMRLDHLPIIERMKAY